MTSKEDLYLFKEIRKGNIAAFEQLFKRFQPRLFALCYSILNDKEAAKDIVQDTFMAFWENKEFIQTDFSVVAYLFKIAQNKCQHYLRKNNIKSNFSDLSEFELQTIEISYNQGRNMLGYLYMKEIESAYEKAIEKLPPQCQEVFTLSRLDDMKCSDIAKKLSISLRTVENHLYKATKLIRREMKQYASFLSGLILLITGKI